MDTLLLAVDVGAYAEQRSRPAAGPPPPSPREGDDEGGGAPPPSPAPLLMQSDFAASLAPLLGLAAPFGNLGVMQLGLAGLAGLPERCLAEAAAQNAAQVMRYLETYAARASLSGFPLRETQTEFEELARLAPGTERLHRRDRVWPWRGEKGAQRGESLDVMASGCVSGVGFVQGPRRHWDVQPPHALAGPRIGARPRGHVVHGTQPHGLSVTGGEHSQHPWLGLRQSHHVPGNPPAPAAPGHPP